MYETTFRILDALSRDLGSQVSINKLTEEIRKLYGSAHYSNVYKALHELIEEGIIDLTRAGKASLVSLDFSKYTTIDRLTEMELKKKYDFLKKKGELQLLLAYMSGFYKEFPFMGPICLVDPERNLRLNRAELLIKLPKSEHQPGDGAGTLRRMLQDLQSRFNMRIDALALNDEQFRELLVSREKNALREMLANKIALYAPDMFWTQIANAWNDGMQIRFDKGETHPAKISEQDLTYNLARFGYTELGPTIKEGQNVGIEYIVTSILMKEGVRRIEAILIILAKNRANYDLLIFLAQKYGVSDRLLGLLRVLVKQKPGEPLQRAIASLEKAGTKEVKANKVGIKQRMKLYNAA